MAAPRAFSLSSRSAHESVSHLQCTRRNKPAASWSQQSKGTWNLEQLMNPDNEWVTSTQLLRSRYGSIYHFCTVHSIRRRPSLLIPRPLLLNFFFFLLIHLGLFTRRWRRRNRGLWFESACFVPSFKVQIYKIAAPFFDNYLFICPLGKRMILGFCQCEEADMLSRFKQSLMHMYISCHT